MTFSINCGGAKCNLLESSLIESKGFVFGGWVEWKANIICSEKFTDHKSETFLFGICKSLSLLYFDELSFLEGEEINM